MTDVETLRTDPLEAPANPRILVSTDGELVAAANPASSRLRRFAVTSSRSRGTAETVALALDRLAPPLAARIAEQGGQRRARPYLQSQLRRLRRQVG